MRLAAAQTGNLPNDTRCKKLNSYEHGYVQGIPRRLDGRLRHTVCTRFKLLIVGLYAIATCPFRLPKVGETTIHESIGDCAVTDVRS